VVLACEIPDAVRASLTRVQHELFNLGGELCIPGMAMVHDADIERLEQELDAFNADLPVLKEFILPAVALPLRTATSRAPSHAVPNARSSTFRARKVCVAKRCVI
jgi:cob(I)alamin adenosyltransferase